MTAHGERVVTLPEATAREVHDALWRAVATRPGLVDDMLERPLDFGPSAAVDDD